MTPSQENNGVQAMDVDLDSPTPPDKKRNLKDEGAGINAKSTGILTGSGSSEMVVSEIAVSIQNKLPSDVSSINSMKSEGQAAEEVLNMPENFGVVFVFFDAAFVSSPVCKCHPFNFY